MTGWMVADCRGVGKGGGSFKYFTRGGSSSSLWFFLCFFDRESLALEESLWQPNALQLFVLEVALKLPE